MKKTLIILPFVYDNTITSLQLVNEKIINSVGRINIEESYFEKPTNRTLNVIPYNGILTEEQKYSITKVIENIINDGVITGIAYIEGEEKQFEQTMQIK